MAHIHTCAQARMHVRLLRLHITLSEVLGGEEAGLMYMSERKEEGSTFSLFGVGPLTRTGSGDLKTSS